MKTKLLLISLTWIILAFIISPDVNMYYTDDWAYAKPVKTFLETGSIKITDWSSMTLLTHIYWGAAFCKVFGYSMLTLRISVLIMGLAGLIGSFFLFKELIDDEFYVMLSTLLIFFNPVYFIHSYTFMTDITYYCLIIWSCLLFVKYLKNETKIHLMLAVIICLFALMTRDMALFVPLVFSISLFFKKGFNKKSLYIGLSGMIISILVYLAYRYWLIHVHTLPASIDYSKSRMFKVFSSGIAWFLVVYLKNTFFMLLFLGLFFLPLVWIAFLKHIKEMNRNKKKMLLIVLSFSGAFFTLLLYIVPKLYTQTYQYTFSNVFLYYFWFPDIHNPSLNSVYIMSPVISNTLLIIGIFSGLTLLYLSGVYIYKYLLDKKKSYFLGRDYINIFIFFNIILYLLPVLSQGFITRYLFFVIPLFIIFIYRTNPSKIILSKLSLNMILIFLMFTVYFTISSTHDLFSFSKARVDAIEYLTIKNGIPSEKIDGGFEWNAWHFYNYNFKTTGWKNWWYVVDDNYVVSWGEIPSFKLIAKFPYTRWLPPGRTDYYFVYRKH